ncbi:MAG: recombinase family protein [candidate division WWE3 bacterium]|nr:recombinase family protein [candidate division WWE3 bacterium]
MKAITISRVSTEEQKEAGNSLPAQTARLEKYCQSKGFEIFKTFSFDESAYKESRSEFDRILDFVLGQKEKAAVCFDKVDRLSRNIFDKRVSQLYDKAIAGQIELHFVSDGQVITDQISAVEKFQFGMSLGLAKYFSDAISDNVKRATEQKLRKGEWPGKARFGYVNFRGQDCKADIYVHTFNSGYVQKAFELYATKAYSMDLLRQKLKDDYGLDWSKSFLDNILKDTFYYGVMLWKGKSYNHHYAPIISKELFDRVQQVKAEFNKKRFKYAGKPYFYRGLIRCAHCGLAVTPEKHKGIVYYHCTQYKGKHGAQWLTEANITEQLGSLFKRLQVPQYVVDQIVEALRTNHASKSEFREEQVRALTQERETYAKRRESLYMDKLDGRITDDEYDKYYQSFRDKMTELDARISQFAEADDNYYVTAKAILDLTNKAHDLFTSSEVVEKRQIVKLVLSNLRLDGKELRYDVVNPFDKILSYSDSKLWYRLGDSNP